MTACPARLWGDPTGLACTAQGEHTTHIYAASALGDAHDASEARAEASRG